MIFFPMSYKFPNLLGFFRRTLEAAGLKSQIEKKNCFPHYRWRLSMTKTDIEQDDIRLEKASKYLIYMEKKISRYMNKGEYLEAWKHFDLMLRKSKVFAIFILNKVDKDWYYTRSYDNLKKIMTAFNRHVRLKEHMLPIHRTYIPKKTPGKVRPLGAPSIESRLVMAALTEFINIYAEKYVGSYQYGFLPKRSSYHLGIEIVRRLSEGKRFYEFDLDSFFNRVDYRRVLSELPFGSLSKWIMNINTFSIPRPKPASKYDTPMELDSKGWHKTDMEYKSFGTCAYKQGFTQGANYSPVLCVIALEMAGFGTIDGLLMGADDGLLEINNSLEKNIHKLKNAGYGIHLAEDKYFGPCQEKFKFYGWEFDTLKQTVTSGEETLTYGNIIKDADENKGEYCKKFFGKSKKYSGKIEYKCGMIHTNKNLWTGINKFKALLVNDWNWTVHEESMINLAPTCNFTLPSAKRTFMKKKMVRMYDGNYDDSFYEPQYYDLNKVGNWCNIRLLDMLQSLSTWRCTHIKEKYYEGNPLTNIPGLSFMATNGIATHIRPFPKGLKTYDSSLEETFLTESNSSNITRKVYWDYLLEDIKQTSLMYKNKVKWAWLTREGYAVTRHTVDLPKKKEARWTSIMNLVLNSKTKEMVELTIHPLPLAEPLKKRQKTEYKGEWGSMWTEDPIWDTLLTWSPPVKKKEKTEGKTIKVETLEEFLKEKP